MSNKALFHELNKNKIKFVRASNLDMFSMWMERAKSDVAKDENVECFKMFFVQWWAPLKKGTLTNKML